VPGQPGSDIQKPFEIRLSCFSKAGKAVFWWG
jgi:hypothetical protein